MTRSEFLLDVAYVLALGLVALLLSNIAVLPNTSTTAPSTLSVIPTFVPLPITLLEFLPQKPAVTASAQQETPAPAPTFAPTVPQTISPIVVAPAEDTPLERAAITLRKALVNIICRVPDDSGLHSITGSGVIIGSKGVILTNAHIAQYFLLYDRNVSCTIRAGSPATDNYKASLIYISPAWLRANADILTQANPIGNGEHDFAFLAIAKPIGGTALPSSFSSIPLATETQKTDIKVAIASYGAQFLESDQILSALFPTVVFGSVKDVFTFASTTVDVIALGGSAAAQKGSSGGGVADASGELVAIITTSTIQGDISTRALDAITASYIRADYANDTGEPLDSLLARPSATSIAAFAPQVPALESIITAQLP